MIRRCLKFVARFQPLTKQETPVKSTKGYETDEGEAK